MATFEMDNKSALEQIKSNETTIAAAAARFGILITTLHVHLCASSQKVDAGRMNILSVRELVSVHKSCKKQAILYHQSWLLVLFVTISKTKWSPTLVACADDLIGIGGLDFSVREVTVFVCEMC